MTGDAGKEGEASCANSREHQNGNQNASNLKYRKPESKRHVSG